MTSHHDLPPRTRARGRDPLAQLCHDLRGHLSTSLLTLDLLEAQSRAAESAVLDERVNLGIVRKQLKAMSAIVAAQLDPGHQRSRPIELADLVSRCTRTVERADDVEVRLEVRRRPTVVGRPPQIQKAVASLIESACRATASGTVHVELRATGSVAEVIVETDGTGSGHVPDRRGHDLAEARSAALSHGGDLEVCRAVSGGTRTRLSLPAQWPQQAVT